jgi:hypothetical protein
MTDCIRYEENLDHCACTYPGCPRKGNCCECLRYHLAHQELPGCAFSPEVERTYDRSFARFATLHRDLIRN